MACPRWGDLWIAVGCAIGAFLMRGAGCTWNDITDREFDGRVERTRSRPIPSGQVSVRTGRDLDGAAMPVGAGDSADLQPRRHRDGCLVVAAGNNLPLRQTIHVVAAGVSGAGLQLGRPAGMDCAYGNGGLAAILLYLSGISWTLFYDTIYAHQDTEDDELIGIKSTARLFGTDTARMVEVLSGRDCVV